MDEVETGGVVGACKLGYEKVRSDKRQRGEISKKKGKERAASTGGEETRTTTRNNK